MIEKVTPSVLAANAARRTEDAEFTAKQVRHTDSLLLEHSRIADAADRGRVAIAGLSYRLVDGTIHVITTSGLDTEVMA